MICLIFLASSGNDEEESENDEDSEEEEEYIIDTIDESGGDIDFDESLAEVEREM